MVTQQDPITELYNINHWCCLGNKGTNLNIDDLIQKIKLSSLISIKTVLSAVLDLLIFFNVFYVFIISANLQCINVR